MGERDETLQKNLQKTRFANLVEKGREKLQKSKSEGQQSANAARPVKIIKANSNTTLFTQETIKKFAEQNKER